MGRPKDEQYWNQVTKEENGTWTCMHCNRTLRGGVSRIKAHVDRIKGQGISICSGAHNNDGVDNNMGSNSINPPEAVNGEDSLRGEVAYGVAEISITLPEGLLQGVDGSSCTKSAFESEINHLKQLDFDLQCEERHIKKQVQWLQSRGKKRKRQADFWLDELQELKQRVQGFVNMNDSEDSLPYNNGVRLKLLIEEMQEHKEEKPLVLSTELVGEVFEENFKKVLKLLADDQVFVIGIYGMGGVGKTLLVSQVENEIKRRGTFKHVFWVTVSHNFSIFELQRDIAKEMGVKLDDEDNERRRSRNLSLALEKTKEKSVLILDDVWKYIDLEKVGIPLKVNGIKVILTTRLKHVCQQMDCLPHNMIQMEPLDYLDGEDLELLMLKLGHNGTSATLSPEVLKIAVSIAKRCCGLPLAISVMARTMKGVDDIHQWKHTWNKLEKLEWGEEVEEEVFKVLRRSYDNLMGKDMQNCFLYAALSHGLYIDELIMKLVDNGLIKGRRSLEEIFDEGHTILNNLQAHSLLNTDPWTRTTHQLVRDMARRIMKESDRHVMVKIQMTWPHMQEWTASNLELVYLYECGIKEIPEGTSPGCPHLSTLIIQEACFSRVPECFFVNMNVMAVLDLSYNRRLVSLPNSVSKLRSLISLVLSGCGSLKHVPPLGELQALSRLVITSSFIEQVPQGLEMLINLTWLDLSNNKNLTLATGSVLRNLTNIQYLDLCRSMITMEDVQGMKMLERFGVTFFDSEMYNRFVQKILDTSFGPETYHISFGAYSYCLKDGKAVSFGDCCESSYKLPEDLTELCIRDNKQWIHLCDALSSEASNYLSKIKINDCIQLESVFCFSHCCCFCAKICNLESLDLENLKSLTAIRRENVADISQSLSPGAMFSHLKYFNIYECNAIETLLTPGTVLQLRNLEKVTVKFCHSMKEIFAVGNGDDGDGSTSSIELPKLTTLELKNLPQLKTVCKGIIFCGSSPYVGIDYCPELERHPTIGIKPFQWF